MRFAIPCLAATLAAAAAGAQFTAPQSIPAAVEITDEPHHALLIRNSQARVFRLKLEPGEATLPHRHRGFYAFLSLRPVVIGNEVRGHDPVLTSLEADELRTSKGGFTVAERNNSAERADLLVIEALKGNAGEFSTPMGGFRFHDAALGELFEAPAVRAYTLRMAAGGRTEQRQENYDRLLVALTDVHLREEMAGQPPSELVMKAGEVRWILRGQLHAVTNLAVSPCMLLTLEFN